MQQTADWTDTRETHFWHERPPFQVKHEIEKLTGILLTRDLNNTARLVYKGSAHGENSFELELRFEAVLPRVPYVMRPPTEREQFRNLYELRLSASAPVKWGTKEELEEDARRAFDYWSLRLQCTSRVRDFSGNSSLFYEQQVRESVEYEEAEARRVEDPEPILAIQKRVLMALRKGKQFRTAHKEGGSILYYNGTKFLREDYGEEPALREFATEDEMIACIRALYDWESRRDIYPHRPSELEVWTYIQRKLM